MGIAQLEELRNFIVIRKEFKITISDDDRYAIFSPSDDFNFTIESITDFPPPIGFQKSIFIAGKDNFQKEISWARSFIRTPLDLSGVKWERIRKIYPMASRKP